MSELVTAKGKTGAAESSAAGAVAFPYAAAGVVFTAWFNDRVRRLHLPTLWIGPKLARVVELHADGTLEVETESGALGRETQFVRFEPAHLDRFLLKFSALGAGAGHRPGP